MSKFDQVIEDAARGYATGLTPVSGSYYNPKTGACCALTAARFAVGYGYPVHSEMNFQDAIFEFCRETYDMNWYETRAFIHGFDGTPVSILVTPKIQAAYKAGRRAASRFLGV